MRPFDGDITQQMTFWDCYESAIHANAGCTDIDKFNYLLRGTAREAVSDRGKLRGDAILIHCFGNKQHIISRHMDVHVPLPAVRCLGAMMTLRRSRVQH